MSHNITAAELIKSSKRVVIKIGSVLIADAQTGQPKQEWLDTLAKDIKQLIDKNIQPIIVSSGAIALGRNALNIDLDTHKNKLKLEQQQAAAAVGSIKLAEAYSKSLSKYNQQVGLVLLSPRETEQRRTHLNARSTINTMLESGIIPIINENDTIATSEIRFGDNDRLGARVAQMIGADTLVLLSTIDGLYTAPPETNKDAKHIPLLDKLTAEHNEMAKENTTGLSTGGMKSKLIAAQIAMNAGCNMIIADGRKNGSLGNLLIHSDAPRTTIFLATEKPYNARKKWIQSHIHTNGVIHIDKGAYDALKKGGSLLPVGVKKVEGNFTRGDGVEIRDHTNNKIGYGLVAHDRSNAEKICGLRSEDAEKILGYTGREELIHRDNLVLVKQ